MSEMNEHLPSLAARPSGGVFFLYRELWQLAQGQRGRLVSAMLLLVGAQSMLLAIPFIAGKAIDALQSRGAAAMADAGVWLSLILVVTAGSWLLHGPGRILERNVALGVRRRIATGLTERLLALPLSWHERHHSGATAHRVHQSANALSAFAQSQFIYLNSAVRLVGPMVALWVLNPVVGMAAAAGFLTICLAVLGFDRAMIRLAHQENDAERRYSAALIDTLGNATTLYALRQARGVIALIGRRLEATFAPLRRAILLNEAKWCTVDLASKALSCALVALFAWTSMRSSPAASGQQTLMLGGLYMVWEYAAQAGGVIAAVAQHFQTFARQNADYSSADVIRQAPVAAPSQGSAPGAGNDWRRIDVRELVFCHAALRGERPSLDQVALSLERGKRYAVIGGSGSGKSTLLRVLAGLYEAQRIVVDPHHGPALLAPSEVARWLRSTATLVPQDAEVFEGTLAENLGLCESPDGAPAAVDFRRALDLARVSEFVPHQEGDRHLDTVIAERALNWSGGQRARVALARGILAARGSGLVLFDEPTASLDPKTEAAVYDNLFTEFADACLVTTLHRLHLLDRFDEVLVMHEGRLVAQGPASVLAAVSPDYRQLVDAFRKESAAA